MSNEIFDRVKRRGLGEGKRLLGIFLYLWTLLALFSLSQSAHSE